MKNQAKEAESKTAAVLEKEISELRKEIAIKKIEAKSNPQKDSNDLAKRKKKLAVLMTMLSMKKAEEKAKQTIK